MTKEELVEKIKSFEGFRSEAYQDSGRGVWTIGFGRTTNVKQGDKTTESLEYEYLYASVDIIMDKVSEKMKNWNYDINKHQLYSLTDFVYNCGMYNLQLLTNNGQRSLKEISEKIILYNKAGGRVLPGLVKRREWEQILFNTPVNDENKQRVMKLQQFINTYTGYNGKPLTVDGVIGTKTLEAIEQIFYNL